MKLGLADIKCASIAEVKRWNEMAVMTGEKQAYKASPLAVWCDDALPAWCREEAAAGRCCLSTSKQPSTRSLAR